jgi:hypothetical protein
MPTKKSTNPDKPLLDGVVAAAQRAAEAKGWTCYVKSIDQKGWRYATLAVSRGEFTAHSVEALVELGLEDSTIKCQISKTSFYGTGLDSLHEAIVAEVRRLPGYAKPVTKPTPSGAPAAGGGLGSELQGMLRRFDRFVRQLARRQDDRPPFLVEDEYDVQDLVHALLRSYTDDVRPEEVAPSYAGASSRMDFLLKEQRTVVEAKLASEKLRDKQIGEQLIIDIQRYQAHPDCKILICMVYDPKGCIRNSAGLEKDLSGTHRDLDVRVIITPQ